MIALIVLNGSKSPKNAYIPTLRPKNSENRVPESKFDDYDLQSYHSFGTPRPIGPIQAISERGGGQKSNDSVDRLKRLKIA